MSRTFTLFLFLFSFSLHAQYSEIKENFCATMEADSALRANNPKMGSLDEFESWLQTQIKSKKQDPSIQAGIYTIPVIVHVIHNGEAVGTGGNISTEQVYSQITVFNNDFRRTNSDTTNTPSVFKPFAADFEIEFCLAQIDTNGNQLTEPGIDRVNRVDLGIATAPPYTRDFTDFNIKPLTSWNPTKYMNIWVLNLGGGIAGYGQFPDSSGLAGAGSSSNATAKTDGLTMYYKCFGTTGTLLGGYNKGRSATHEVGHFLGLRHIWGDANCGNDYCNDTPKQQSSNGSCPSFPKVTCSNGPNGDMFMNYMDYTSDGCKNIFTTDQKTRAQVVLQVCPRRRELSSSTVCIGPSVSNFTASQTEVCKGQTISYADQSLNAPTSWSWNFPGGTPSSSTNANPSVKYNTPGIYSVTLSATNINGGTPKIKTSYIQVNSLPVITHCNDTSICFGDSTSLYASGGSAYVWTPSAGLNNNTISNPLFQSTVSTMYQITGTNTNGCSSTVSVSITVYPELSTPTITQAGSTLSSSAAVSYQWYLNGNIINGATSQSYEAVSNGIYKVVITDAKGCSAYSSYNVISSGIKNTDKDILNIYPNPSKGGEVNIVFSGINIVTEFRIENILGELVHTEKTPAATKPITLGLDKGIYLLTLQLSSGEFKTQKIIVY